MGIFNSKKPKKTVVLYVGATKLVGVRLNHDPQQGVIVESWVRREPKAFRNDAVGDGELASREIRELLMSLTGGTIPREDDFHVVISGSRSSRYAASSSIYYANNRVIGEDEISQIYEQTRSIASIPLNEVVFHTVNSGFLVGDIGDIRDPLGLEGKRLGVNLHLFTLPVTIYRSFELLFEELDLFPEYWAPRSMAATYGVTNEDERRQGMIVIDIGADETALQYYFRGFLCETRDLTWGSEDVTRRFVERWDIVPGEARRLKEEYGTLQEQEALGRGSLTVLNKDGSASTKIAAEEFTEYHREVLTAGLEKIGEEVDTMRRLHPHVYQVVVTGGSSRVPGVIEFLQERLKVACRQGIVTGIHGPTEMVASPANNAILGFAKQLGSGGLLSPDLFWKRNLLSRIVRPVKAWIHEYF